jgi:peptidoglycan/LPS O-acetylase OafA/YrhL
MESSLVTAEIVPQAHKERVAELDGVRALAVLAVMAGHLLVPPSSVSRAPSGLPRPIEAIVTHGWLGVDLFFVLSGLLITSILLGSKANGAAAYFGRFYERRALRILPLYVLVLAILAIAYVQFTGPGYFALCLAFAANLAPLAHVAVPNGGGPLWSLAVEEQFYLFWPVLVLLLNRRALVYVLFAIVVCEPVLRAIHPFDTEFTWMRADGLAAGALLALWFTSKRRTPRADAILALALLGVALLIAVVSFPFGGMGAGTVSIAVRIPQAICIFAALVIFAVSRSGARSTAALRIPFAIITAEFSYCLYLIHVPLIDGYQTFVNRFAPELPRALGPLGANLLRFAIILCVAYALAALSRRYLEKPFLRMGRSSSRPAPMEAPAARAGAPV